MSNIGIDIGTKNVVLSYRTKSGPKYLREVNGYYRFPRSTKFIENMLADATITRSDGTKRPAKWVKLTGHDGLYVLGADAEELAYAHNDTLLRPMAEGGVAYDEEAMTLLATIVQGLLESAEHEVGKFTDEVQLCYCTTATALNKPSNMDYHRGVVDLIISGYESKANIHSDSINEAHAIVLKESPSGSGIGISWGAGTVTVCYCLHGLPIYSFSWVGSGDWIDMEVARRHGFDPENRHKKSKETPTTVCRAKEKIDLTPGKQPTDRLGIDIMLHYQILAANVVRGIVDGFVEHQNTARIDRAINVYMAGGTSSPAGFVELVEAAFAEAKPPFEIGKISRSVDPLYAVAEGCLIHSEMQ